jgi:hypothetical protein
MRFDIGEGFSFCTKRAKNGENKERQGMKGLIFSGPTFLV